MLSSGRGPDDLGFADLSSAAGFFRGKVQMTSGFFCGELDWKYFLIKDEPLFISNGLMEGCWLWVSRRGSSPSFFRPASSLP